MEYIYLIVQIVELIKLANPENLGLSEEFLLELKAHVDKMEAIAASPPMKSHKWSSPPNPVSRSAGSVTLYLPQNIIGTGTCTIYDAQGNRIDHQEVNLTRGTAIKWDLCNQQGRRVASGCYPAILQITDSMGMTHFAKAMVGVKH